MNKLAGEIYIFIFSSILTNNMYNDRCGVSNYITLILNTSLTMVRGTEHKINKSLSTWP